MDEFQVLGVTIDRTTHTVLVVDDNPATLYSTARTLRAAGFKTEEAENGKEALSKSESDGISLVVLDVHLPDINGFEVCRMFRQRPKSALVPVIHLSATYVEDKDKVEGLNSGADAYLTHPAEPSILIATVQALIRARSAEEQLRKSEAKFRAIYTQAESGIALINEAGVFVDANPALLRMLGRPSEEVLGQRIVDFAPVRWVATVERLITTNADAGNQWSETFALSLPEGEEVHMEWTMSTHLGPGLLVAAVSNISARMLLQEQRENLLEREKVARTSAEQHSQTKDNFIAVLSHELRNPLNAILMGLHVLLAKGGSPEIVKGLRMIERNAKAQARIISDILDVSRINSGKLTLDRERIDLASVVASVLDGMKEAIDRRHLSISLDVSTAHDTVWLDATRMQQICWNLFNNAIKFSEPRGKIEITLSRLEDALVLVVKDYGKGIAPEFLKTIFDKFSQGDTPGNRAHGGLGLGMSIVKHLADLHGGTVDVHSDGLGCGATVTLKIPAMAPPVDWQDRDKESAGRDPESDLTGVSILVVEDEPQSREMLTMILRDRGAHVATAENYDEAIQSLMNDFPDLLLSDIGLPGRDGYELVRELRRIEQSDALPRHPAIALTAFNRIQDSDRAIEAGFDAHVAKPLRAHDLVTLIADLVRN